LLESKIRIALIPAYEPEPLLINLLDKIREADSQQLLSTMVVAWRLPIYLNKRLILLSYCDTRGTVERDGRLRPD